MQEQLIQDIRAFNRFYTDIIGLLDQHLLDSPFSLPEARVLFELAHRDPCTASDIMTAIRIDKGYLSRILLKFKKQQLILRKRSKEDGREVVLSLTAAGKNEFRKINEASHRQVVALLQPLSRRQQDELLEHLRGIRQLLEKNN